MQEVLRHKHRRKRGLVFGSSSAFAKLVDIFVIPIGIAGIAAAVPQLFDVWFLRNASGVSVFTWGSWAVFSCVWVVYGAVHKAPAIVYLNIAWVFIDAAIALGAFLYQ